MEVVKAWNTGRRGQYYTPAAPSKLRRCVIFCAANFEWQKLIRLINRRYLTAVLVKTKNSFKRKASKKCTWCVLDFDNFEGFTLHLGILVKMQRSRELKKSLHFLQSAQFTDSTGALHKVEPNPMKVTDESGNECDP